MKGIALGTVQFGLPYGIANTQGQPSLTEVAEILAIAQAAGIDTLDTAIAYGSSEERLGNIGVNGWRVISKLPSIPDEITDVKAWVTESVEGSLKRLNIHALHALLLHHPDDLLGPKGNDLFKTLHALKLQGLIERIGISIYDPSQFPSFLSLFKLDLIQAPFNVLDQRLLRTGWLSQLYQQGIEVHTRSVFLQGLLLMNRVERPQKFSRWKTLWTVWETWLRENQLTPLQACLSFALAQQEVNQVLVGVDTVQQLQEILKTPIRSPLSLPSNLYTDDIDLINPSRWNSL